MMVNNSININKPTSYLKITDYNKDDETYRWNSRYWLMKKKCKQWWSTMPLISTKERACPSRASTLNFNDMSRRLYCSQWFWDKKWVLCWFWLHRCFLPTFLMLIGSQIVIVLSTDFIFCSYLYSNQITSIQEFNNLTSLAYL
jgi:hypothetical protein